MTDKFPLEKILTVSINGYLKCSRNSNFRLIGVHCYGELSKLNENFAEKVPKSADVVVDYRVSIAEIGKDKPSMGYACGTALINDGIGFDG